MRIEWTYIFVVYLVLPVHGQTKAPHSNSDKGETSTLHQTSPPITVTVVNQQTPNGEEKKAENEPESYFHTLLSANNLPNIALFAVGIFGIVVAIRTLGTIERQTKATEDAAAASLKQIGHLIASERAWLTISSLNKEDAVIQPGPTPYFYWVIKNVGNTPAKIIETQAVCRNNEEIVKLAPKPDYGEPVPYQERLLGPGDSAEFHQLWKDTSGRPILAIEDVNMFCLDAFGYVRYRSVLEGDEIHESRFCDVFIHYSRQTQHDPIPIKFRPNLEAPPAYTKAT